MTILNIFGSGDVHWTVLAKGAHLSASYNWLLGSGAMVKPEERKYCQKRHSGLSTFMKYLLSINLVY